MHRDCAVTVAQRYEACQPTAQMPKEQSGPRAPGKRRKHVTRGGLTRETAYLYEDEEQALEERAERERSSKSEIIRRALREYLGIS